MVQDIRSHHPFPRVRPATFRLAGLAVFLFVFSGCKGSTRSGDEAFYGLLDRIWEWQMETYPESATYEGLDHANDRWTDRSLEAIRMREQKQQEWLDELTRFENVPLSEAKRREFELLKHQFEQGIKAQSYPREYLVINQLGGIQASPAHLLRVMPRKDAKDYENIIARLEKLPEVIGQHQALLEEGLERNVTPPRVVMRGVPGQVEAYLGEELEGNPLWRVFAEPMPDTISQTEAGELRDRARAVILGPVREAYRQLHEFLTDRYLPNCLADVGMDALPDGDDWYRFRVQSSTTTDLTPGEIHRIGLEEVDRIHGEMKALAARNGYAELSGYIDHLRNDPKYFFTSKEDLLKEYRSFCKRLDASLIHFFATLPRLPYGIELIPEFKEASAPAAYYQSGSARAQRPGIFYVNGHNLPGRPSWEIEALAIHETVPGHHLQIALADELEGRHEVAKNLFYTAYSEGWALYCEKLGSEMGFYQSDAAKFGRLNFEMWRAVRLVVDTGLHAMDWDRQQAIDYFARYTAKSQEEIVVEVDRYLVWPAQALTYKIGELKVLELRARAEEAFGDAFDIRAFHDVLLGSGALPLSVLEEEVDEWIRSMGSGQG